MRDIDILYCSELLAKKKLKIAFIESATAGALAASFARTPHSGDILVGGMVCYDADVKTELLKIPKVLIDQYTAESAEVTLQMAVQGRLMFRKADVIIAVTGLTKAGGSEHRDKPVGTVFLEFILPSVQKSVRKEFKGSPDQILDATISYVALFLVKYLDY
ncbi:CinA family protein [Flavobacterium sp. JP2137]|uniref:CinA family protein n=1 Tax=Flavobacterium sp. JP2137 TaxID=3414510 RepID=UPI003D2FF7C4